MSISSTGQMASLQHSSACCTQRRLQLPCRAEQAPFAAQQQQQQQQQPAMGSSRRRALGAALLLPAAAALAAAPRPAAAAELLAESVTVSPALDVISWPQWVDRTFSFSYPPGFQEMDPSFAAPPKPRAGVDQVSENPLKAAVRSSDGEQRIDVVVKNAASLKRTLFQVTDISLLGDARSVAKLVLPPGAVVLAVDTVTVAQPPKDTGTVLGVIERDPVNYYSYEVLLPDRTHLQLTTAAQLGRLYIMAATVPDSKWAECGAALKEAALSFRLRYKI